MCMAHARLQVGTYVCTHVCAHVCAQAYTLVSRQSRTTSTRFKSEAIQTCVQTCLCPQRDTPVVQERARMRAHTHQELLHGFAAYGGRIYKYRK